MLTHRALGRDLELLVVSVVDNRRPMLSALRAMLAAIGVGRIETFEHPAEALDSMRRDVPDIVFAADELRPLSGCDLVRQIRAEAEPLCLVPALITTTHAKPNLVDDALIAGAHQLLVLPTSASTLCRRLDWLLNDDRPFEVVAGHYVVAGLKERLELSRQRPTYVSNLPREVTTGRPGAWSPPEAEASQRLPKVSRG
jgi:two-component system chemotaxis response regulator CheY